MHKYLIVLFFMITALPALAQSNAIATPKNLKQYKAAFAMQATAIDKLQQDLQNLKTELNTKTAENNELTLKLKTMCPQLQAEVDYLKAKLASLMMKFDSLYNEKLDMMIGSKVNKVEAKINQLHFEKIMDNDLQDCCDKAELYLKVIDSLRKVIKEDKYKSYEMLWAVQDSNEVKFQNFKKEYLDSRRPVLSEYIPIFSAAVIGHMYLAANDKYDFRPAMGARFALNTYKLLGYWRTLDLWYEYNSLKLRTTGAYSDWNGATQTVKEDWDASLTSVGISFKLRPIIDVDDYSDGFNLSLGGFWTKGFVYNQSGYYDWSGLKVGLEYYAGKLSWNFPIEVFFGGTVYTSFKNTLRFGTRFGWIEGGKSMIGLQMGFRYNIWRSPYFN